MFAKSKKMKPPQILKAGSEENQSEENEKGEENLSRDRSTVTPEG
jgi:hypothetical protein